MATFFTTPDDRSPTHLAVAMAGPRRMRRAMLVGVVLGAGLMALGGATYGADSDGDLLRDWVENKWGVTQSDKRDSDADGVIDSAEDSDGDGLSDLGEQRFGLDPGKRDSDGDGRSDAREDHDRDGRSNALEQDQRRVPRGLRPSLARAPADFPPRRFECQTPQRKSHLRPCRFGDTSSSKRIVIFGDSHAAQWVPALDRAGEVAGWKIIQMTKTACPSISATVRGQYLIDGGHSCRQWRTNVFRWLRRYPPDVIVISNRGRWTLVENGRTVSTARRARAWRIAMARTLAALPARSKVVVLADTPLMNGEPVFCLRRNTRNIAACATRRGTAMASWSRAAERQAAKAAGAKTRNLNARICSYDPCPLVQGRVLVWRDHGHLTATFSRRLWPSMRKELIAATDGVLKPSGGAG